MASLLRLLIVLSALGLAEALPWGAAAARAQQQGYGQTIDSATGSGGGAASLGSGMSTGKSNSVLDAVNPIDLMNRIRRNQALDDATPPGDAVDQALRDYHGQTAAPTSPSQAVKSP